MRARLISGAFVALSVVSCVSVRAARRESSVTRAVFSNGRLWLLSTNDKLSSMRPGQDSRVEEALPEPALDLCLRDGRPQVVTCPADACSVWTLRRWTSGTWSKEATVMSRGEKLIAMSCATEGTALLTSQRLIDVVGAHTSEVNLSQEVTARVAATVHATSDHLFVGINNGEWGGGLRRIDRRTGQVTTVQPQTTKEPCDEPLDARCDPVNGIVASSWKPGCLVAAIGLVHFRPRGRLVEICGDTVQRLYTGRLEIQTRVPVPSKSDEPFGNGGFLWPCARRQRVVGGRCRRPLPGRGCRQGPACADADVQADRRYRSQFRAPAPRSRAHGHQPPRLDQRRPTDPGAALNGGAVGGSPR